LLLDNHLEGTRKSADWTVDPVMAPDQGPRRRKPSAAAGYGRERRSRSAPMDRRSPSAPVDRRHNSIIASVRPSQVFRPFFGISFVAILIAAMLLMLCYRYFTIQAVTEQTGAANVIAADAAANANHEQIADYLARRQSQPSLPFPDEIAAPLYELVKDTPVDRVTIVNARGEVVFSTGSVTGDPGADDTIVAEALAGRQSSHLNYRDLFNSFAFRDPGYDENMVHTGLPLQQQHQGPVVGVFEIQTDVKHLVAHHERAQLLIAVTASLVMLVLYGSLLTTIRRIGRVIDVQQDALRERSDLLAELSAEMMNVQEEEKQRIAIELHERVAQTLAAIKLNIESTSANMKGCDEKAASMLQSLLTPVHEAIQEVRATASGLRPASLDDLGLLPTLQWLCREFAAKRPDVTIEQHFLVGEQDIPVTLRPIIFRVAEDACAALAENSSVHRVGLTLGIGEHGEITLGIRDDATPPYEDHDHHHPFARVRERALLSGGTFSSRTNTWGGLAVKAIWSR
jgi:two-component system NarL family sensor kinase